jgi:hypothetical protein
MRLRRNASVVLTTAVLVLAAAACGGESENPQSEPSTPDASDSPAAPTTTAPAWEKEYTKKQLDAYDAALGRWEEYETRSAPIWARGKATEAAGQLFKGYFPSPNWQGQFRRLASYEQAGVKIEGKPGIYWTKPKLITDNGLSVVINQCVDYTQGTTTQNGEEVEAPDWVAEPNLRTISLSKPKGHDWLIYEVVDASSGKARPCKR